MPYPHHIHMEPSDRLNLPDLFDITAVQRREKQLVEVILLKEELLHDIEATVKQLDDTRQSTAQGSSAALPPILPKGAAENYLLLRHLDAAVNQAVSRCQAYLLLPSPFVRRISTNHTHGWEEKSIFLAFPHNWPPHCVDALRDSIHNFVVERTLQRYLLRVDPKAAELCDLQAQGFYDEINALLNTRLGPMHLRPTFCG